MASTANFFLMAVILLLAISQQSLFVKPELSFHAQGDEDVLNNKTSLKKTMSPPETTTPSHTSYDPTEPKPPPINDTEGPELKSPPLPPKASKLPGGIWAPPKKSPHHVVEGRVANSVALPPKISPDRRIPGLVIVSPTPSIAPHTPNTGDEWYSGGVGASNEPDPDFEAPPLPKVCSVPAATRP